MNVIAIGSRAKAPRTARVVKNVGKKTVDMDPIERQLRAEGLIDGDSFFSQSDDEFARDLAFTIRGIDLDSGDLLAA